MAKDNSFKNFQNRLQKSFQPELEHQEVRQPERFSYIGPFCKGLAVAMLHFDEEGEEGAGLYGYIDPKGETLIPFVYHDAKDFREGLAVVAKFEMAKATKSTPEPSLWDLLLGKSKKSDQSSGNPLKYGFISKEGALKIDLQYEDADSFGEGLAPVRLNGRYHYIDQNNSQLFEQSFDAAHAFKEGFAAVQDASRWFFINPTGQAFFQDLFDEVNFPFCFEKGCASVLKNGERFMLKMDGSLKKEER